ncbi:hypothetical protein ANCCAN_09578 [Ancylostoma caninum]|uniref:Uncharacterized protein n=1 Tax=Ancylostoma caninum TaxID=29170 RepID=A0A368GJ74_ANCCA|nr:hypothetical protein ANCCAN_09578 [Ancylostoma caninum]
MPPGEAPAACPSQEEFPVRTAPSFRLNVYVNGEVSFQSLHVGGAYYTRIEPANHNELIAKETIGSIEAF